MTCKFKAGETYRTRDGRDARVYATDGGGNRPIHGAVRDARGVWMAQEWFESGRHSGFSLDLMPPKRKVWVSLFRCGDGRLDGRVISADAMAQEQRIGVPPGRIALFGPVEIEDTET